MRSTSDGHYEDAGGSTTTDKSHAFSLGLRPQEGPTHNILIPTLPHPWPPLRWPLKPYFYRRRYPGLGRSLVQDEIRRQQSVHRSCNRVPSCLWVFTVLEARWWSTRIRYFCILSIQCKAKVCWLSGTSLNLILTWFQKKNPPKPDSHSPWHLWAISPVYISLSLPWRRVLFRRLQELPHWKHGFLCYES